MEGREKIKIQENNGFAFGEGFHFDLVGVILDEILFWEPVGLLGFFAWKIVAKLDLSFFMISKWSMQAPCKTNQIRIWKEIGSPSSDR